MRRWDRAMNLPPMTVATSVDEATSTAIPMRSPTQVRDEVRARWLVRVRWGEVSTQALVIAVAASFGGAEFPIGTLLGLLAVLASTNVWLVWRLRSGDHIPQHTRGIALVVDTVLTTAMLYLTGGPSNPFSVFYLVLITMAAVTLGSRWTWLVAGLAVAGYAALFLGEVPMPADMHDHSGGTFSAHMRAMWIALTMAGVLTAYFVTRLARTIEQRDQDIELMRERAGRHERVAALTTLAAGAAHELATPLATVMVAAGSLHRALGKLPASEVAQFADDVQLIRSELERCRRILDGMAAEAGDTIGERLEAVVARDVVSQAISTLDADEASRVDLLCEGPSRLVVVPRKATCGALASLLRNALQAGAAPARVAVRMSADDRTLCVEVRDAGCGMPQDVLARAGDPFFTTRPPGRGRGLGLFLARSLAERLGGRLLLTSAEGHGTTASFELPLAPPIGEC